MSKDPGKDAGLEEGQIKEGLMRLLGDREYHGAQWPRIARAEVVRRSVEEFGQNEEEVALEVAQVLATHGMQGLEETLLWLRILGEPD